MPANPDDSSDDNNRAQNAWIPPMKAASAKVTPRGTEWAAELKWDGIRVMVDVDRGDRTTQRDPGLKLWSSNGRILTSSFPDLAPLAEALGTSAVLDGEIVAFDGDRPSFGTLQRRIHVTEPSAALLAEVPVALVVFDLLRLDGLSLLDLDYVTRRRLLDDLLDSGDCWMVSPYTIDGAASMLDVARQRDLEGVVVKRLDSRYQPGTRSKSWLKIKVRRRQEFVVGGWLEGQGGLAGRLGSLIVGVWEGSDLVVAGRVGSGLTDDERRRLDAMLVERQQPLFTEVPSLDKTPHWVEPTVVVEVEFSEWPDGAMLRHPTYCGVRIDCDPNAVVRE